MSLRYRVLVLLGLLAAITATPAQAQFGFRFFAPPLPPPPPFFAPPPFVPGPPVFVGPRFIPVPVPPFPLPPPPPGVVIVQRSSPQVLVQGTYYQGPVVVSPPSFRSSEVVPGSVVVGESRIVPGSIRPASGETTLGQPYIEGQIIDGQPIVGERIVGETIVRETPSTPLPGPAPTSPQPTPVAPPSSIPAPSVPASVVAPPPPAPIEDEAGKARSGSALAKIRLELRDETGPVRYRLNQFEYTIRPGERQILSADRKWTIVLAVDGEFGDAAPRYTLGAGDHRFVFSPDAGWTLEKAGQRLTPEAARTATRVETLPPPLPTPAGEPGKEF